MDRLARILAQRQVAAVVVLVSVVLALIGAVGALRVEQDDDLLAFLPKNNKDVAAFHAINEKFGGLDVALVGIEVDDAFDPDFFARLQKATKQLNDEPIVGSALSLANVQDFTPAEGGGIETDLLVRNIPADPKDKAALVAKVMSRDLVAGQLIAKSNKAVIIYAFAGFGADPRGFADRVREIVTASFPNESKYWGGAPFISTYIYSATQEDLRKLTPWAVVVIIALIILAFRDVIGAGLALLSTGMGIAMSMGLMGFLGVEYNIVLSSMPVILFAVGSAYGIHVLACYYRLAQLTDCESALVWTLRSIGPTVLAAGLTTVAGLASFVVMDIAPLRTFGVFTALGILCTLVLSLTFIPAVIRLLNLAPKTLSTGALNGVIVRMVGLARNHRLVVAVGLLAVAAVGAYFAARVDTRMDQTAFFAEGSPPDRADRFMAEHFGGSMFIQLSIEGDFDDPHALREVQAIADRIARVDKVSNVQHIAQVVAQINDAMAGEQRIPDTSAQVKLLYTFLAGNPALSQLISGDRKQVLLHAKVTTSRAAEVEVVLAEIERVAATYVPARYRVEAMPKPTDRAIDQLLDRLQAMQGPDSPFDRAAVNEALRAPVEPSEPEPVAADVVAFLASDEAIVELSGDQVSRVASAAAALGPWAKEAAVIAAVSSALQGELVEGEVADPSLASDIGASLIARLNGAWARQRALVRAKRVKLAIAPVKRLVDALRGFESPTALVLDPKGDKTLATQVTGLPILHRGMSESVARNQVLSLSVALAMVLLILSLLYRSVSAGVMATAPTVLTLLVIYGGMGVLGVHLDIGTSMLASLIIGAGVDYSVHLVSAWHASEGDDLTEAAKNAAMLTGPAIWTNALMVAAGFYVLTLGEAKTLQNVGGLTSAAMIAAAFATFLTIPVLAKKRRYSRFSESAPATADGLVEGRP